MLCCDVMLCCMSEDRGGVVCKVKCLILSCLGVLVSDRQTTNERTLVVVESLSRLKSRMPGQHWPIISSLCKK